MSDEDEERQLRIELMQAQIDKTRLDMDRVRQEIRMENRKFFVQASIAFAAVFTAGGVVGGLIVRLLSGHG